MMLTMMLTLIFDKAMCYVVEVRYEASIAGFLIIAQPMATHTIST